MMWFTTFDEAAYKFAQGHPDIIIWTVITQFGDAITLALLTIILLYAYRKQRPVQVALGSAAVLSATVVTVVKYGVGRARPIGHTLLTPSFPSGHTLGATAVYGTLAVIMWKNNYRWQAGALLIIPLLVGISRIMLLEHWLSDVIAGWVLGGLVVWASMAIGNRVVLRTARSA